MSCCCCWREDEDPFARKYEDAKPVVEDDDDGYGLAAAMALTGVPAAEDEVEVAFLSLALAT